MYIKTSRENWQHKRRTTEFSEVQLPFATIHPHLPKYFIFITGVGASEALYTVQCTVPSSRAVLPLNAYSIHQQWCSSSLRLHFRLQHWSLRPILLLSAYASNWSLKLKRSRLRIINENILSVMLVFSAQLCELSLWFNSPPPSPFPVWISIQYTRIQCVKGGDGVLGLRQINSWRRVPYRSIF
jgi:hypothetical protein